MSAPQGQQFSLKWNNFSQHIVNAFEDLRGDDDFTDVTLSCEGKRVKCHKVLLSACSVYFKETFRENPCKHPVIILKGVEYVDLQAVVTFMYNGQVNISQERLSTFLQTAELLQIKGLTEMNDTEEAPTVKKRSHTAGTSEPAIPSLSHSLKSGDGSLITPEIVTARPPTPKRKRIGPASFMQMQNQSHSNNDSQVPVTTQAGSSFHSSSANLERGSGGGGLSVMDGTSDTKVVAGPSGGVSSSTGGFINPETVIIPSTSMLDPSGTHLSSSNDSYSHGIIKFEEEDMLDEDDDYEKNNLSEDNDNSLHDMLGNVEHEHGSMGSFMAGPSGQGIKILNVGTDSSAHVGGGGQPPAPVDCEISVYEGDGDGEDSLGQTSSESTDYKTYQIMDQNGGATASTSTATTSTATTSTVGTRMRIPNSSRKSSGSRSTKKGGKEYPCNLCEKRYRCRSSLESHMRLHQGEVNICQICGRSSSRRRDLKRHMMSVHKVDMTEATGGHRQSRVVGTRRSSVPDVGF